MFENLSNAFYEREKDAKYNIHAASRGIYKPPAGDLIDKRSPTLRAKFKQASVVYEKIHLDDINMITIKCITHSFIPFPLVGISKSVCLYQGTGLGACVSERFFQASPLGRLVGLTNHLIKYSIN